MFTGFKNVTLVFFNQKKREHFNLSDCGVNLFVTVQQLYVSKYKKIVARFQVVF